MIRRPPRSTQSRSSAASDVYKRQRPITTPCRRERGRLAKRRDAPAAHSTLAPLCLLVTEEQRAQVPLEDVVRHVPGDGLPAGRQQLREAISHLGGHLVPHVHELTHLPVVGRVPG